MADAQQPRIPEELPDWLKDVILRAHNGERFDFRVRYVPKQQRSDGSWVPSPGARRFGDVAFLEGYHHTIGKVTIRFAKGGGLLITDFRSVEPVS